MNTVEATYLQHIRYNLCQERIQMLMLLEPTWTWWFCHAWHKFILLCGISLKIQLGFVFQHKSVVVGYVIVCIFRVISIQYFLEDWSNCTSCTLNNSLSPNWFLHQIELSILFRWYTRVRWKVRISLPAKRNYVNNIRCIH